jgi:hypothetical protein
VDAHIVLPGGRHRRLEDVERPDAAARAPVRLLEHDHRRRLENAVTACNPVAHLLGPDPAGLRRHPAHDEARVGRCAPRLEDEHVRALLRQQLAAAHAEYLQRDLIRHGRRGDEERGLLAEQLRRPPLELVDRRILAPLLVAELGGRDRSEHPGRRLRGRIGAKIDHAGHSRREATPNFRCM